jgi:hypothetical protein
MSRHQSGGIKSLRESISVFAAEAQQIEHEHDDEHEHDLP